MKNRNQFFPDPLLTECSEYNEEEKRYILDIEKYRNSYCEKYFEKDDIEKVCHEYLTGMQWVITYYSKGVPSWRWYYPYHYAPNADMDNTISN